MEEGMSEVFPGDDLSTVSPIRLNEGIRSEGPALTIAWHFDPRCIGQSAALDRGITEISRWTPPFELSRDRVLPRNTFLYAEYHQDRTAVVLSPGPGPDRLAISVDGVLLDAPRRIPPEALRRGVIITISESIAVCLHMRKSPRLRGPDLGMVGTSDAMEEVRKAIVSAADGAHPIHIRGETGTGKELVAKALAALIKQAKGPFAGPFITFSMAELRPETALAELFGHTKGAFTGASEAKHGRILQADGGVLFLDEIGAPPLEVQEMLLRFIEEGEVWPVGGDKKRKVRVRLLTATDKNLEAAVARGTFGGPLLQRIKKDVITLLPLRERREDIGSIFRHFLELELVGVGRDLKSLVRRSTDTPWLYATDFARLATSYLPGNARTLSGIAGRLVKASGRGGNVKLDAVLAPNLDELGGTEAPRVGRADARSSATTKISPSTKALESALILHNYNVAAAAAELGVHRSTIYDWLRGHPEILRKAETLTDDEIITSYDRHEGDIARMAVDLRVSPKPLRSRVDDVLSRRQRKG